MERLDYGTRNLDTWQKTYDGSRYDKVYILADGLELPFLESHHADNYIYRIGHGLFAVLTIDNRFECIGLHLWSAQDDFSAPESVYMQNGQVQEFQERTGIDPFDVEPETVLDALLDYIV